MFQRKPTNGRPELKPTAISQPPASSSKVSKPWPQEVMGGYNHSPKPDPRDERKIYLCSSVAAKSRISTRFQASRPIREKRGAFVFEGLQGISIQ